MDISSYKKDYVTKKAENTASLERIRSHSLSGISAEPIRQKDYYKQIVDIPNKTERILAALVEFISEAGLKEGDLLPREKQLCEIFGVGARSLREALIELRALGLVRSQQGTGWFIKRFDLATSLQFLAIVIKNFSHADLNQIMTARLANEPAIAALAAEHISDEGLAKLERALTAMKETTSDLEFRLHDRKFHDFLAQECGNNIMAMFSSILTGLFYMGQLLPKSGDQLRILQQHQEIYDAVRSRSPKNAEKTMSAHLLAAREFVNNQITLDRIHRREKSISTGRMGD